MDSNVSTAATVLSRGRHPAPSPSLNSIKQQSYTESIPNGKTLGQPTLPIPVLRAQQPTPSSRVSLATTQEKVGFKPIEQQQQSSIITDTTSRPTPIHPQTTHYPATGGLNFVSFPHKHFTFVTYFIFLQTRSVPSYGARTPLSDHVTSPMVTATNSQMMSNYQAPPRTCQQMKFDYFYK